MGRLVYLKILGGIAILMILSLGAAVLWIQNVPPETPSEMAQETPPNTPRNPASQEVEKGTSDPLRVDFDQRK